ncbi:MAG: LLM class flavin-dependent oxidoreductase [Acidimicrobiia bacterium]
MLTEPAAPFTSGMTIGTQPPLRRINLLLKTARVTGFDTAWVADHFLGFFPQEIWDKDFSWIADPEASPHAYYDYQTLLGHLARRVGRIRLGVGVTEPIRRHPVLIAQAFLTLAHLTKRAPILGIGAGEAENTVPYGLDFSTPVSRLEEALEVVRRCFSSREPFDYEGSHFTLDGAVMDLAPPAGRVPEVWVAAHRPRMLGLTGRYGDGWYPTFTMSPDAFAAALSVIQTAARDAGRDPAAITPGWQAHMVVGRTEKEARAHLGTKGVRFMSLLTTAELWRRHGYEHPFGDGYRGMIDFIPQRHTRRELEAAISAVPVDVIANEVFVGTPAQIEAQITAYYDAGLRHLVLQPISALSSRRAALFSIRSAIGIQRRLRKRFARTG